MSSETQDNEPVLDAMSDQTNAAKPKSLKDKVSRSAEAKHRDTANKSTKRLAVKAALAVQAVADAKAQESTLPLMYNSWIHVMPHDWKIPVLADGYCGETEGKPQKSTVVNQSSAFQKDEINDEKDRIHITNIMCLAEYLGIEPCDVTIISADDLELSYHVRKKVSAVYKDEPITQSIFSFTDLQQPVAALTAFYMGLININNDMDERAKQKLMFELNDVLDKAINCKLPTSTDSAIIEKIRGIRSHVMVTLLKVKVKPNEKVRRYKEAAIMRSGLEKTGKVWHLIDGVFDFNQPDFHLDFQHLALKKQKSYLGS